MDTSAVRALTIKEFPPLLAEIPQPPKALWAVGNLPPPSLMLLAVVGSRHYTSYGKQVVEKLMTGLRGYPIGIISGLALGIDGLAHEAALRSGLYTMAVPGSGLDPSVIYPRSHRALADRIVASGGGLLSELPPTTSAALWTFPQRNRIMAGMCTATLLIEAGAQSGTLITARLAVDYNRELLVVPGSIFSPTSIGTHQFLKLGATPVTTSEDIIEALKLPIKSLDPSTPSLLTTLSREEMLVLSLLREPCERDTLIRRLGLTPAAALALLMGMEMNGFVAVEAGVYTALIQPPPPPVV